jgi:hypothetical protein
MLSVTETGPSASKQQASPHCEAVAWDPTFVAFSCMLRADRTYWGIETGLHLRLDVTAGEDRSRVRNRTSALNLAMIRRAVVSVAVGWIKKCPNPRKATLNGLFDHMAAKQSQKAFSLVTTRYSSALSSW